MAGINIQFVADVAPFLKGTKNITEAMDDVGDSLDDVARDAQDAGRGMARSMDSVSDAMDDVSRDAKDTGRDIERALDDAKREGQDASGDLERTFRQDFDKIADHAKDAGQKVERATDDSMSRGGEYVGEFKDEARQNFGEVASSFSGDMDSAADLVQGTLGGLAGSIAGPVGIAAGIGGALAGIGYSLWQSTDENAAKSEERIQAMYEDMLESGLNYLSDESVMEGISAIVQGTNEAAISMDDARQYADDLGISVDTVVAAFAGSPRAMQAMQDAINAGKAEAEDMADALDTSTGNTADLVIEATRHYDEVTAAEDALNRVNDQLATARERTETARAASENWTATGRQSREEREREAEAMRVINERYRALEQSGNINKTVTVIPDLDALDKAIRNYRPTVTIGAFRHGQAVI